MTDIKSAYCGEAQLIRWGDGGQGHTVTLRLSNDDPKAVNPFKGLPMGDGGQRMQIVCVLIDDHDEPTDPDHAKQNSRRRKASTKSSTGMQTDTAHHGARPSSDRDIDGNGVGIRSLPSDIGPGTRGTITSEFGHQAEAEAPGKPRTRSQFAGMRIKERDFQEWIGVAPQHLDLKHTSVEAADAILKARLGIQSKTELDVEGPKAQAFDKLLASFDYRNQVR